MPSSPARLFFCFFAKFFYIHQSIDVFREVFGSCIKSQGIHVKFSGILYFQKKIFTGGTSKITDRYFLDFERPCLLLSSESPIMLNFWRLSFP